MAPRRHRDRSSRDNFRRRPPVSEPFLTSLVGFVASLHVPVYHEPSDEIDWSRPRNSWNIHQEQTYFNMFGRIASDDFTIDQLLTGSSSNPQANRGQIMDELRVRDNRAYAEGSSNRDLFPGYFQETATVPIQSFTGPNLLQREESFKYGEGREEDEICVVCQNDLHDKETISTLNCGHKYHLHCIERWLRHRNACPLCNATVLPQ